MESVRLRGRLEWMDLEGGVYVLHAEDGRRYDLHGVEALLPRDSARRGLDVEVEGVLLAGAVDFHMVGPIVRVARLQVLG